MSDKSGISPAVLSLPSGGGAIQGLGETFSPDLHTGSGQMTIPLALLPGRNGWQPALALQYNSGAGNGLFGVGWAVSLPFISRKSSRGIPRYDGNDTFLLPGADDLVPTASVREADLTVTRYRPRVEGAFALIERLKGNGVDRWRVRQPDGSLHFYGTPPHAGAPTAVEADPAQPDRIFAWRLVESRDLFDNRICYHYRSGAAGDAASWSQLYPAQIDYGDCHDATGVERFLFSVRFLYDGLDPGAPSRPDPVLDGRAGFGRITRGRCRAIELYNYARVVEGELVRRWEFRYLTAAGSGLSLLESVTLSGHDGGRTERMPPITFRYSGFTPEARTFQALSGHELPPVGLSDPSLELADLTGDGLPDLVQMNGVTRYWRNLGNGCFDRPRMMADAPAGLQLADPTVQLMDADGDGRIDLLSLHPARPGYFPLNPAGHFERRGYRATQTLPAGLAGDPLLRLVDLDGDGVTDALRTGSRFECFFHDPHKGWHRSERVERSAIDQFPDVSFADPRVRLADLNGDGLQDIVLLQSGDICYWPSLGHGRWAPRVRMAQSPRLPADADPARLLVGDVNGDGAADLILVDDRSVTLWLNRSGFGWSEPLRIAGTPGFTDAGNLRLADLYGAGVDGLLWSGLATGGQAPRWCFLDFTGGRQPHLLVEAANNLGAVTRINYQSSTSFQRSDEVALPFPVQVVSRVATYDLLAQSELVTDFVYRYPYWDGEEREFRGFGLVEQTDAELIDVGDDGGSQPAPLLSRHWFHQGRAELAGGAGQWPGDPAALAVHGVDAAGQALLVTLEPGQRRAALRSLRGRLMRSESYGLDSAPAAVRPYAVTEHAFSLRLEATVPGRPPVIFPHATASRTTQWERGHDPLTQITAQGDFTPLGLPQISVSLGVPRGRRWREIASDAEPYLATVTATRYAGRFEGLGPDERMLGERTVALTTFALRNDGAAPALTVVVAALAGAQRGELLGQSLTYYDGAPESPLPLGELGAYGLATRTEQLAVTDAMLRTWAGATASKPLPAWLARTAAPLAEKVYPSRFLATVPAQGGYHLRSLEPAGDGGDAVLGWYVATQQTKYDVQLGKGRGLKVAERDPLGNEIRLAYDLFELLPVRSTGPTGIVEAAALDLRLFLPVELTEPNGNRSRLHYSPLGLVERRVVLGPEATVWGDSDEAPTVRHEYDLSAFYARGEPVSVRTTQRLHFAQSDHRPAQPPAEPDAVRVAVEFSDGFGRLLQMRTVAEQALRCDPAVLVAGAPAELLALAGAETAPILRHPVDPAGPPLVVVSGRKRYDVKGNEIETHHPYFSWGLAYAAAETGTPHARMRYDARRELVATSTVDGAERSRYFGRPDDLTRPASVTPSPWLRTGYDANDNAGRTHPQQASGYSDHWNTPVVTEVDALGRTVRRSEESRSDGSAPIAQHLRYDLRGNLVAVEDAQGRTLQRTDFDLLNRAWVTESVDSGRHVTLRNAAGDPVENVTPTGGRILFGYDRLRRLIGQWASDEAGDPVTLRFRSLYGDEGGAFLSEREARAGNLLGRKAFHFDEGGLTRTERYSFAGDLLEQVRIPLQRAELLALLSEDGGRHRPIDWSPPPGSLAEEEPALLGKRLAAEERRFSAGFDALGRMIEQRFPASDGNARPQVTVYYNEAGLLTALAVDGTPYITEIAYDAGGNRIAVLWGNGLLTRYCYDPATRLLARLRSERCKVTAEDSWLPLGDPVQDQRFYHDLSGNHVAVEEQVRGCGIIGAPDGADRLLRTFTYDSRYQLCTASGREQRMAATAPWDAAPRSNDPTATRLYVERYRYDEDGMLVELRHVAEGGNFTRSMVAAPGSHRLASLRAGEIRVDIQSDVAGQVTGEGLDRHFAWDAQGRLAHFRVQSGDAPPSLAVRYLYNETGERVAKLFFRQGRGVELTHYVAPGYEVVERLDDAASPTATLTVLEGSRRLASLRFGPPLPGDSLPAVCFTLADHLGSAALTLDANGELLVREEYTPFGETSFGSYARKRYRFGSHERDGESGLYYQGLRYYAPWVARWISADPAGMVDGVHLYRYVRNNPLKLVDPSGLGGEKPKGAIDSWPPMCRVDEDSRPKANPPPETEKQQQTQNPGPIDGVEMMRIANQPTIGAASPYLTSYNPVNVQYKLITSNIDAVRSSGMAGMAALVILATAPDMDPVKANGIIKLAGLAEGTLMQGAGDYARSRKGYEGIDNLGDPTQLPNIKYAYQGTKGTAVSVPNGTKATASIMASKTLSPAKSVTSLPHAVNVSGSIATANGAVRKLPAEARVDAYRGYMQETMALHPDFVVAEIPVTGDTSGRIFARSNGTTTVITGAGQMYHGDLADTRQFTPTFTANGIFTGYQPNYSALKFVK